MRARFFRIILIMLVVVAIGATLLHGLFLRQERLQLIDHQVRETTSALLDSELGEQRKVDFDRAEEIISDELGESRIGKFFVIRNASGKIIFQSASARVLPIKNVPQDPQWVTLERRGQYIRVLNLKLPRIQDRTLQVGLVIDEDLLSPNYLSGTSVTFILMILSIGLVVAWFLTSTLLKPIQSLSEFVSGAATKAVRANELPGLPIGLQPRETGSRRTDEFNKLLAGLDVLIQRINRGYQLSRFWSYQMAHELKTPIAIMETEIDNALREQQVEPGVAASLKFEISHVAGTISSFLAWAEIENSHAQKRLFVARASRVIADIEKRFFKTHPGRIQVVITEDFQILASLPQLEQVMLNIVANALYYSPLESVVEIEVNAPRIVVRDRGAGIPASVMERLGEPFNKGEERTSVKGHGLGLAFVRSVTRLYGWKMDVQTGSRGTDLSIVFPTLEKEDMVDLEVSHA